MPPAGTVDLVAVLRTTRSGAATFLALGDDGNEYWVKAHNNPQGSRSLIPERIVTLIGERIGAPVRPISLVRVPPGLAFTYHPGYLLTPGISHGSLNLANCKVLDDWSGVSHRDGNRRRTAYISALWDLCLGNDPQWLADFDGDSGVWSFDHGFWFAGEADWSVDWMRRVGSQAWGHPNIGTASSSALLEAADQVEALSLAELKVITRDVPTAWGTTQEEMAAVAELLFLRTEGVASRLRAAASESDNR